MGITMAPLLMHSPDVPHAAKEALRLAMLAPVEHRDAHLELAAHVLYRETDLDCAEARDLVGLPTSGDCH